MNLRYIPFTALALLMAVQANAAPADSFGISLQEHRETILSILKSDSETLADITTQGIELKRLHAIEKQWEQDILYPKSVNHDGRPSVGPMDAPVTITVYTSFDCGYCRIASKTLETLLKEYPEQVRLVFKIVPRGDAARLAAKWFIAAGRIAPERTWEYHEKIFSMEKVPDAEKLRSLAAQCGISTKILETYLSVNEKSIIDMIASDKAEQQRLGLAGTPMFLVNDMVIRGAESPDTFRRAVERALKNASKI